ncbi:hypothetical protein L6164_023640 [Bauhinia variegata]|uniref:Uncharacterized protein n=1 Tax=Bauhinia variegata TaxID=167791 RepID=A0ACB9MMB8_BAUVA|nr:hypothetical protein L6164_023640 [Bauhinia variegata]
MFFRYYPNYEIFYKRSLLVSISDTQYLHNMAGDTEIRKGYGMRLDNLIQNTSSSRDKMLVNSLLTLIFSKRLIS